MASSSSSSSFDVLNSDCMYHLLKFLSPVDIAYASEAIPSFFTFATDNNIFSKCAKLNFFAQYDEDDTDQQGLAKLKSLVQKYGPYVTQCCLNGNRLKDDNKFAHVKVVLQGCPNLVHIRLQTFQFSSSDINFLSHIKQQIAVVEWMDIVNDIKDHRWMKLWEKWSPTIRLFSAYEFDPDSNIAYLLMMTDLERLSLNTGFFNDNDEIIMKVLQKNAKTLTSLSLVSISNIECGPLFFYLPELAPNLVHLRIEIELPESVNRLHELKHLKHLQFICDTYQPYMWNLSLFTTLDELDIVNAKSPLVEAVAQIPCLRALSIRKSHFGVSKEEIIETIVRLPNLKSVYMSRCPDWTTEDLVKVLELNRSVTEITFHYCASEFNFNWPTPQGLIDCLAKQRASAGTNSTRPTVQLTYINDYTTIWDLMSDQDRNLFRDNGNLLRLVKKHARYIYTEDNEDGDDIMPMDAEVDYERSYINLAQEMSDRSENNTDDDEHEEHEEHEDHEEPEEFDDYDDNMPEAEHYDD